MLEAKLLAERDKKSDGVQVVVNRLEMHEKVAHQVVNMRTKIDRDVGGDC